MIILQDFSTSGSHGSFYNIDGGKLTFLCEGNANNQVEYEKLEKMILDLTTEFITTHKLDNESVSLGKGYHYTFYKRVDHDVKNGIELTFNCKFNNNKLPINDFLMEIITKTIELNKNLK